MKHDSDFGKDLETGLEAERLLRLIAEAYIARGEGATQVKNDRKVSETGNVYIERESRGTVSGIDDSRSPYWAFILDGDEFNRDVVVIIKTERLREICRRSGYGNIKGGDYLYLVENHRNGNKVYQDIIEYRGRVGGNSKARAPYNTLRRWQASVDAFGKPKSGISTTKGAIGGGNGTFIKSAKQTTGKN